VKPVVLIRSVITIRILGVFNIFRNITKFLISKVVPDNKDLFINKFKKVIFIEKLEKFYNLKKKKN
jgi:hypothetical protein